MTTVTILSVSDQNGDTAYRAFSGDRKSSGKTAGEALDAISAQIGGQETGTLVIVQHRQPDQHFDAKQICRLEQLMSRWREQRDRGQGLAEEEQKELEELIDTELAATGERATAILGERVE